MQSGSGGDRGEIVPLATFTMVTPGLHAATNAEFTKPRVVASWEQATMMMSASGVRLAIRPQDAFASRRLSAAASPAWPQLLRLTAVTCAPKGFSLQQLTPHRYQRLVDQNQRFPSL